VPLTQDEIDYQAKKASWYVEIDNRRAVDGGDVYVVTGNGVNDLDRLLSLMPTMPVARFQIDVGTQYSDWRACNLADIQALRTSFIECYGTVNRPGWPVADRKHIQLPGPQVQIEVQ
jgi:hypothetical protein